MADEVGESITRAWRDGIGPDDRVRLRALAAADPTPELAAFAAWLEVAAGARPTLPDPPDDPCARIVHEATRISLACLTNDRDAMNAAIDALHRRLEALPPDDRRATTARAFADLAIGDAAQHAGDAAVARRRFEDAAEPSRPVALRIAAMLKLAGIAVGRDIAEPARAWARKALALAERTGRVEHATRARLLVGLLHVVAGDTAAVREILVPDVQTSALARIVTASLKKPDLAMPMLADGLREAIECGDVLMYTLYIVFGARLYAATGYEADALITISAGISHLSDIAPRMTRILSEERASWKVAWGAARFNRAESRALELLKTS